MRLLINRPFADGEFPYPPSVIDSDDQGGLGWRFFENPDDPRSGPTMQISNYRYMNAGDTLDIFWENPDEPVLSKLLVDGEENLVTVRIPPLSILEQMDGVEDRVMQAWYRLDFFSGSPATSAKVPVRVKLNVPGLPAIDPDYPYENKDLPAPEVDQEIDLADTGNVTVTIRKSSTGPAWVNMFAGDVVTLYWGDQEWVQPAVTQAQEDLQAPLLITLTRAQVTAGGSGELKVFYGIRDIVGNWSRRSLVADVSVIGAEALPPPTLRPVDLTAGVIDLSVVKQSPNELYLQAPVYSDRKPGDVVTMTWTGRKSEGVAPAPWVFEKTVSNQAPGAAVNFQMPIEHAEAIGEGTATLVYTVKRIGGGTARSPQKTFVVTGGSKQSLPAPVIAEAVAGSLNPWDSASGAHVQVKAYAFMAAGDRVALKWNGTTAAGAVTTLVQNAEVETSDIGSDLSFVVDTLDVDAIAGGSLTLSYTVTQNTTLFDSEVASYAVSTPAWSLIPPAIPEAVGGTLSPAGAATVRIGSYDRKAMGDRVTFTWSGEFASGGVETLTGQSELDGATALLPVDFPIAADVVARLSGGKAVVSYSVENAAGLLRPSRPISVAITSLLLDLPAPTVTEAQGEWLDPTDLASTASVVFTATYAGAAAGDIVTMRCLGSVTGSEVTNQNVIRQGATTVTVTLPKSFVEANRSGTLAITGDVAKNGVGVGRYGTLVLSVGQEAVTDPLTIDTADLLLAVGEDGLRMARNGVTPYVFTSSAANIVQITNTSAGNLRALAAGTATITVTDKATPPGSASYRVVVTATTQPLRFEITTPMELELGALPGDGGESGRLTMDPTTMTLRVGESRQRLASGGEGNIAYNSQGGAISVDTTTGVVHGDSRGEGWVEARAGSEVASYKVIVQ